MELEHSFTVPVPKERAWDVLLDVERVAPCMPGTTLDSVDGDEIHGRIKVKVGPISMTYTGKAEIVEKDEQAGLVRLEASGKETKGAGTASASVRSVLESRGNETYVTVLTSLNVTGKPAQFGRGVMNEVSGKLRSIFAANLAAMLSESHDGGAADSAATTAVTVIAPDLAGLAAAVSIDELHLSARAVAGLRRQGVTEVGQLAAKTADELLAIDGIGPASVDEIKAKLAEHGFALKPAPATTPQPDNTAQALPPTPASTAPAGVAPASVAPPGITPAATATDSPASTATASPGPAGAPGPGARFDPGPAAANGQGTRTGAPVATGPRDPAPRHQDDSINLLKVAGLPVLKRSLPVLAGVTAVLIIGWRRKVRRRNR